MNKIKKIEFDSETKQFSIKNQRRPLTQGEIKDIEAGIAESMDPSKCTTIRTEQDDLEFWRKYL